MPCETCGSAALPYIGITRTGVSSYYLCDEHLGQLVAMYSDKFEHVELAA